LLVVSLLVGCSDGGAIGALADGGFGVDALADAAADQAVLDSADGEDVRAGQGSLDVAALADARSPDVERTSDAPGPVAEGGQCNSLVPAGPKVRTINQPSGAALPTALGGAIAPGKYQLANVLYYALSSGCVHGEAPASGTLVVTATSSNGGTFDFVIASTAVDGTPVEIRSSSTFTTEGNTVTTQRTCPTVAARPISNGYTATASELRLYERSAESCNVATADTSSVTQTDWIKD
jgi:hypothetical protein